MAADGGMLPRWSLPVRMTPLCASRLQQRLGMCSGFLGRRMTGLTHGLGSRGCHLDPVPAMYPLSQSGAVLVHDWGIAWSAASPLATRYSLQAG